MDNQAALPLKALLLIGKLGLKVIPSYDSASGYDKRAICNGCGAGGWKFDIIPDNILGLKIKEACDAHDWMYHFGLTLEDKETADDAFLWNLNRLIDKGNIFLRYFRRKIALGYYEGVKFFGERAFLADKEGINKVVYTPEDLLNAKVSNVMYSHMEKKLFKTHAEIS